jgi:hypothetical protein
LPEAIAIITHHRPILLAITTVPRPPGRLPGDPLERRPGHELRPRVVATGQSSRCSAPGEKFVLDTNTFNLYVAAYAARTTSLPTSQDTRHARRVLPYPALGHQSARTTRAALRCAVNQDPGISRRSSRKPELDTQAEVHFATAQDADQTGDDFILGTVFFASVLFFAGIFEFRSLNVRIAMLGGAAIMLVFGLSGSADCRSVATCALGPPPSDPGVVRSPPHGSSPFTSMPPGATSDPV